VESLDYWRLCEEFNIVQAALLVVGFNPDFSGDVESWAIQNRPKGYEAAKTAICGGLRSYVRYKTELSEIESDQSFNQSEIIVFRDSDEQAYFQELFNRSIEGNLVRDHSVNIPEFSGVDVPVELYHSTVNAVSLKKWLRSKGITKGFFFPELVATLDFLDPTHPRYAPKLAAAVKAWQAVIDPVKKSPKQALGKWLREHAVEFGLTNEEGQPIETAIEECSKVANWDAKGGATKTPT
jgi:hypothetical protein